MDRGTLCVHEGVGFTSDLTLQSSLHITVSHHCAVLLNRETFEDSVTCTPIQVPCNSYSCLALEGMVPNQACRYFTIANVHINNECAKTAVHLHRAPALGRQSLPPGRHYSPRWRLQQSSARRTGDVHRELTCPSRTPCVSLNSGPQHAGAVNHELAFVSGTLCVAAEHLIPCLSHSLGLCHL